MPCSSRVVPFVCALCLSACGEGDPAPRAAGALDAEIDDADAGEAIDAQEPDASDEDMDSASAERLLTIRFKGKVGAQDYACGESYPAQGTTALAVRGRAFRFFVHDVRLIDAQGNEVPLALETRAPAQNQAVALLDFGNVDGRCPSLGDRTNDVITGYAAPGDYRGIALTVGVPEDLNHGDPAAAPAPLRGSGMAWNWVQGYRFFVGELEAVDQPDVGQVDGQDTAMHDASIADAGTDGESGTEPGLGVLHLGSTGCVGSPARGISCAKQNRAQIRLSSFDPDTDSIAADLGALFTDIDLTRGAQCHSRGDDCGSMFSALGVDLESGEALETQMFLRVE